ncbi:bacitracin ABC transporter permease [uncultured Clostridium sp.]|uniref:bacitracin ABC transporter permease n=1 Tax=uncultured Clostridium sp. TaxID=59620 RepID=UPI0028ED1B60|nr:bacitracin ABC transporter permease [uncultured Clostridium sp.]
MSNLIRLELKRFSLRSHVQGVVIANFIILALSVTTSFSSSQLVVPGLPSFRLETIDIAKMLVIATFIVWEAVLIAIIIIEEFRSKTISLLYTYPVNRKELIATKLFLICSVTLAFIIFSEIFQYISIYILSRIFSIVTFHFYYADLFNVTITVISAILLGLLPMYIGMIRKSTIATILSSLAVVTIAANSQGSTAGLISIPIVAVVFGLIGLIFAGIAIKNITTSDL